MSGRQWWLAGLLVLASVSIARSEELAESPLTSWPLRLTLQGWADRVWLKMADRSGNILGRHDGTLQRFFSDQDDEYRLDERTSGFPVLTDAVWFQHEDGLRFAVGSIDKPHLLTQLHLKKVMALTDRWQLKFDYHQEESFDAQRHLVLFTFIRQRIVKTGGYVFLTISPKFFKPDVDLELGGGYRWGEDCGRVELTIAALDLFNNTVFSLARSADQAVDEEIDYRRQPYGVRLAAHLPFGEASRHGRIELFGGLTNRYRYRVEFLETPQDNFDQRGTFHYVGLLIERPLLEWLTAGVAGAIEQAETTRRHLDPSAAPQDLNLDEETTAARIYVLSRPIARLTLVALVDQIWRPEKRRFPNDPSETIDHHDRELLASLWAEYAVTPKFHVSGELLHDRRTARGIPDLEVDGNNQRLSFTLRYGFLARTTLAAGANVDLDDPAQGRFDGAHLYLVSLW